MILTYSALDNELKIEELSTTLDSLQNVIAFEATINRDALISSGTRVVQFNVHTGYAIIDKSKPIWGDEKEFSTSVIIKQN